MIVIDVSLYTDANGVGGSWWRRGNRLYIDPVNRDDFHKLLPPEWCANLNLTKIPYADCAAAYVVQEWAETVGKKTFQIKDRCGNVWFRGKEFTSIEAAEEFLNIALDFAGRDADTPGRDFYVIEERN